jgi:serine/threonine protein kinase/Tol biopolymer transport system component
MELKPGAVLDRYRLEAMIGQGGMGVVWKATDTTLQRPVALKFLSPALAQDEERLARFDREARVLASLRHPGIATIHGFESVGATRFLVMELVPGETLASRLARGPLPVPEALAVALQVAAALEAAHERGVVHRDLKPQNIQLDAENAVKVLDFGLARAFEADGEGSSSSLEDSPTIRALTSPAVLLGTAAYMSPEQARGRTIDRRSDIWSFGVVLFEALTGRRLFTGESVSDTIAAVLRQEVPWGDLPSDLPPAARRLLERCLERDPRQRLRDIGEARIALERVLRDPAEGASERAAALPRSDGRLRTAALVAGAMVLGVTVTWLAAGPLGKGQSPPPPMRRFQLPDPTTESRFSPVISPDGTTVAYLGDGAIWIQPLHELSPRRLAEVHEATKLFWSPDSRWLGFVADEQIGKVSLDQGSTQVVARTGQSFATGGNATWGEDGRIVGSHATSTGLFEVSDQGGEPRTLFLPDSARAEDFHELSPLPGGRGFLVVSHNRRGVDTIVLIEGGRRKTLLELPGQEIRDPVYSPSGHIVFERRSGTSGLWAIPFDLDGRRVLGDPVHLVDHAHSPSVSADGSLVYLEQKSSDVRYAWVDRTGAVLDTLGAPMRNHRGAFGLAPDGQHIVDAISGEGGIELWMYEARRNMRTRLPAEGAEMFPSWSPSGTHVVYQTASRIPPSSINDWTVLIRRADGSGRPDTVESGGAVSPQVTPDGLHVLYVMGRMDHPWEIRRRPLSGVGPPTTILTSTATPLSPQVSPDGRWLAYVEAPFGALSGTEVYVCRYPSGEGRWQISSDGGLWPRWSERSDRIHFVRGENVMEVTVGRGDPPEFGPPVRLFTRPAVNLDMPFDWTPVFATRGDRFLILLPVHGPGSESLVVWENWSAGISD